MSQITFVMKTLVLFWMPVAYPGFPVGVRGPRRGAWTPEAATFRN